MSDRTEERTVSDTSTDELLRETERMLEESGPEHGDAARDDERPSSDESSSAFDPAIDGTDTVAGSPTGTGLSTDTEAEASTAKGRLRWPFSRFRRGSSSTDRSRGLRRFVPGLPSASLSSYFVPKEYLVLTAVFAAGYFVGGMTIPLAGALLGMFVTAFAVGLLSSSRRYAEVTAAGASVGAVMAAFNYAVALIAGFGGRLVVAGVASGLVVCLLGYYFGRDLRDGLTRSTESEQGERTDGRPDRL